jgi:hypothetical protein
MKIHLVCFNTKSCYGIVDYYQESFQKLSSSFLKNGGDEIHHFVEETLPYKSDYEKYFFEDNKESAFGFYAFKPLIISHVMEEIPFGDVILYHDVGRPEYNYEIKKDIKKTVDLVKKTYMGIGLGRGPFSHNEYTRNDCFELMNCDFEELRHSKQLAANWGFYEKNHMVLEFISKWKEWCLNYEVVRSHYEYEINHQEFSAHRWDQSILTNLHFLYNLETLPNLKEYSWEKDINNFLHE